MVLYIRIYIVWPRDLNLVYRALCKDHLRCLKVSCFINFVCVCGLAGEQERCIFC